MGFGEKLQAAVRKNNSLVCVGLDPDLKKLPAIFKDELYPLFEFNKAIIEATSDLVCAYKPNSAFYEALGSDGIVQLKRTCTYLHKKYPAIPIILDAKRADIGNTNDGYAEYAFDYLGADAITVQPYLGSEALEPFLARKDKGVMVLCRTSNPGAGEFQDLLTGGKKLYEIVAKHVATEWNKHKNCQLVVGSTYPKEMAMIRKIVGQNMVILVPGTGAQGGDMKATLKNGLNKDGEGLIINSSRAIIFASRGSNFAHAAHTAAEEMRDEINKHR